MQRISVLTDNTNRLITEQGQPAAEDLRKTMARLEKAGEDKAIAGVVLLAKKAEPASR